MDRETEEQKVQRKKEEKENALQVKLDSLSSDAKRLLILDAGSSGTRVYSYAWEPVAADEIPKIIFLDSLKTNPAKDGIHTIEATFDGVKAYLDEIFNGLSEPVKRSEQQPKTPVLLLATAGVRSLEETDRPKSIHLIQAIKEYIDSLEFDPQEVRAIHGKEEAIFGWVAVNYLKENFSDQGSHTVGFVEMGGMSMQIAFRPNRDEIRDYTGDLTKVRLGAKDYHVYTDSWAELGANRAWEEHQKRMVEYGERKLIIEGAKEEQVMVVKDPCLPKGYRTKKEGKEFLGTGIYLEALRVVNALLPRHSQSTPTRYYPPGKVFQKSSLIDAAPKIQTGRPFIGTSVFMHTTRGLRNSRSYSMMLQQIKAIAQGELDWATLKKKYSGLPDDVVEQMIFRAAWVVNVLHKGFGFPTKPEAGTEPYQSYTGQQDDPRGDLEWVLGRVLLYACGYHDRCSINATFVPSADIPLPYDFSAHA